MKLSTEAQFRLSLVAAGLALIGCIAYIEKIIDEGPSKATVLSLVFFPIAAVLTIVNAVRTRRRARPAEKGVGDKDAD